MKTKDRKCGFSSRLFKTDKIDWAIPREGVSSIVSVTNKLYFELSKKTKEESAIINLTCANRILKLTLQPRVNPLTKTVTHNYWDKSSFLRTRLFSIKSSLIFYFQRHGSD